MLLLGESKLVLPVSKVNPLPSKEVSVDGLCSRSEKGQTDTECSQKDADPWVSGATYDAGELKEGNKTAYDRSPKACKKQDAGAGRKVGKS